eukprot:TRINITY_DN79665_c0_g1_i1.p1 TRINITY_DN79665_c0_g1~~TRINITY_DN79665_c0_g1_i1.p1  ORF type:complete len:567 (+),score=92.53 TRINITY_DN79665_c0_g1_i1:51-1703(+)
MHRLHRIAAHIHGPQGSKLPLWAELMDAGHEPLQKPQSGCRCTSGKWQYVCSCYPCMAHMGREDEFDWTPSLLAAKPASLPAQWRPKSNLAMESCAGKDGLPRPSPPAQEPIRNEKMGSITRMTLDSNGQIGPATPSVHPRFSGIATFARLPQLHEFQALRGSSSATLHLKQLTACDTAVHARVGGQQVRLEAEQEASMALGTEAGTLELEIGDMKATMGLWALPQDRWSRNQFELTHPRSAGNSLSLEFELLLEKEPTKWPVDIALLGVPFDSGCSYRPGARFGPEAIRANSRLIRPYMIEQQQRPLLERQVVDCGDVAATPFGIDKAVTQIYEACKARLQQARRLLLLGGDHTLSYPGIKAVAEKFGPVVLVHFDSHMDTFPPMYGQDVWHGAPFRNCWNDGLLAKDGSTHIGIRATTYASEDFQESDAMGIATITAEDVHEKGVAACVEVVHQRYRQSGGAPVYLSIDIDVLDPSVAPGTGTPEFGGLLAHQLLQFIRGLKGLPIVAADVVEVAPAYDHAGITAMAAANVVLEEIGLISSCMDSDGF